MVLIMIILMLIVMVIMVYDHHHCLCPRWNCWHKGPVAATPNLMVIILIAILIIMIIMIIIILTILIMSLIITSFVMGKVADIRSRSLWDPGSRIPLSLDYQTPFCRGSFSIVWAFVLVSLFSRQSLEWKHKRINCFIVITVRFGVKYIKINLLYSHYL